MPDVIKNIFGKTRKKNHDFNTAEKRSAPSDTEPFELDFTLLNCLVIDDNVFFLDLMRSYLEKLGSGVECAENGAAGLALFREAPTKYNIILVDIEMPVMDGLETAKRIRESGLPASLDIPVIAVTGSLFADDPRTPLFSGILRKPFAMEQLQSAIKQTMLRRHNKL